MALLEVLVLEMDKNTQSLMFSSSSSEWATPQQFFDRIDEKFEFTLDCCATPRSAKCEKYFTKVDNALTKDWSGHTVWMNPPYGREIKDWIRKAYNESKKPNTKVVCLIPARTDTLYWHNYCMNADEVYFIKGRLKFDAEGCTNAAPLPSALVVFSGGGSFQKFGVNVGTLSKNGLEIL